jgi:hypothetical protein
MPAKTQMLETITPKRSEQYLDMYGGNRAIRQSNVDRFVALIRNGKFRTTHQGLAFHEAGHLVDGQHRLWAIIEAQKAVEMWVARGLTDEDVLAIDCGTTRDMKDIASYAGIKLDPMVWTVAKILALGITMYKPAVPFEVVRDWYEFYKDGIDYAVAVRSRCQPVRKKFTAPLTAAIARAYYGTENEKLLSRMFEVVQSGQKQADADNAAVVLRDAWLTGRLGNETEAYFKMCAAIRAFMDRRAIRTLQRAESEVWTLPKLPASLQFTLKKTGNSNRAGREVRERFLAAHA